MIRKKRQVSDAVREKLGAISAANVVALVQSEGREIQGGAARASISPGNRARLGLGNTKNKSEKGLRKRK